MKFNETGICILKGVLNKKELDLFYNTILNITFYHLRKIKENKNSITKIYNSSLPVGDKLSKILELYEKNDKEALYQLQKLYSSSIELRNIIGTKFLVKEFKKLLGLKENQPLLINGPGIFINRPKTKRLLYKWHSESHYYPKRRNFLNIWFPIFFNKSEKNGTMFIKEKSHLLNDLPFNEYQGYDKSSENKKNHFIQYEVPENFVKNLKTFKSNLNVGDILVFHRKSIHTSTPNLSKKYSFAVVFRVWDISKDLTMSGDLAVSPYRDVGNGRPNLEVDM
tara:strand:- start:126 stop:965 length:840 start_codon:yes stop_codon:yes gene_type:complete